MMVLFVLVTLCNGWNRLYRRAELLNTMQQANYVVVDVQQ